MNRCKCGCGRPVKNIWAKGHHTPVGPDYEVDPETDCWLWLKATRMGYGRKTHGGELQSAHVWYWEQENGPKPPGLDLDHLCHNRDKTCLGGVQCKHRRCVNPAHLQLVRRTTNVRRGRQTKLTQAAVDEIRAAQPHWGYVRDLAEKHGVARITVSKLRSGAYWKD